MTESSNKAACILIVEDEAAIRTLISFACAAAGYEVKCAESAIKAQSIVDNNPPDLVLLDYMLPELSGVDWLEKLRATLRPNTCLSLCSPPAAVKPIELRDLMPAQTTTS